MLPGSVLAVVMILTSGLCDEPAPPWPTAGWQTSTPREEGIDPAPIEAFHRELEAGEHGYVDSLLIIRNGKVVAEHRYEHDYVKASAGRDRTPHPFNYDHPDWHPYLKDRSVHTLQSVTKSIASTLIGIAIHQGAIENTKVRVLSFFPERKVRDPDGRKGRITLEDILTMRAGFEWDEWTGGFDNPENDCLKLESSKDWVGYVLQKPMAADPGSVFVYNSGASHLLSAIIRQATGMTIDRYAEKHLFGPLGIRDYHWKKTPRGLPDTEGGLYLVPRDLAKIGYLFLRDGMWEEKRILPEGWVAQATKPWVADMAPKNPRMNRGYGYQWWVLDDGAGSRPKVFAALGYGGQYLLVCPRLELMAVFTGWNIHTPSPPVIPFFRDRLVPATAPRWKGKDRSSRL